MVARPEGCPSRAEPVDWGDGEVGCGGQRGGKVGLEVKGLEGQAKECRLNLNSLPSWLPSPPTGSPCFLSPLQEAREERKAKEEGKCAKGEGRKGERKRDIPLPFCQPHLEMLLLVFHKELEMINDSQETYTLNLNPGRLGSALYGTSQGEPVETIIVVPKLLTSRSIPFQLWFYFVASIYGENIKGKKSIYLGALQGKFILILYNSIHTLESSLVHSNLQQKVNNTCGRISVTYMIGQGLMP